MTLEKKTLGKGDSVVAISQTTIYHLVIGQALLVIRLLQQNFGIFMFPIYESMNFGIRLSSSTQTIF